MPGNGQGMNNGMNQNMNGGMMNNGMMRPPMPKPPSTAERILSNPAVGTVLGMAAGIGGAVGLSQLMQRRNQKMMMRQMAMMRGITKLLFLLIILGQNPYEVEIRNEMMKQRMKQQAREFKKEHNPGFLRRMFRGKRPIGPGNPYEDYNGHPGPNMNGGYNRGGSFNRGASFNGNHHFNGGPGNFDRRGSYMGGN
uniref:HIG1 domain-containing protein n=1 Tax=Strongyloides papillosus TaxID=174720 RepID=A0A0N5CCI4_STREA